MGVMERHAAGTVCWAELATRDAEGAKRFYRGLFGWELEDVPIGAGAFYTMARLQGRDAAALYQIAEGRSATAWRIHVSVADADLAARKAVERGARLAVAPAEVPGAGRFALVRDATGAALGIWQAQGHIGAEVLGLPGALAWCELVTRETDAARKFYGDWLGWESRVLEPGAYALFLKGGHPVAGMIRMAEERRDAASHWRVYFQSRDCGASVEKARRLGAECDLPPTPIPGVGTVALLTDPQGGPFALMQASSEGGEN
jgi:predicted enzyme related to lactoylglutathione lyase